MNNKTKREEPWKGEIVDRMSPEEVGAARAQPFYVPGEPYLWVQGFGWARVGFYVGEGPDPFSIRVAACNHFRNAGKDYGALIREGSNMAEWRYEGDVLISLGSVQTVAHYHGLVPRGPLAR